MTALTFSTLRLANAARVGQFLNKHGERVHSRPDGSDWTPAQWLQALVGKLGEFANIRKKFERGDLSIEEYTSKAKKELADIQTYLDLLAMRCLDVPGAPHQTGVDLGQSTVDKFNEVSDRSGSEIWLVPNGALYGATSVRPEPRKWDDLAHLPTDIQYAIGKAKGLIPEDINFAIKKSALSDATQG